MSSLICHGCHKNEASKPNKSKSELANYCFTCKTDNIPLETYYCNQCYHEHYDNEVCFYCGTLFYYPEQGNKKKQLCLQCINDGIDYQKGHLIKNGEVIF